MSQSPRVFSDSKGNKWALAVTVSDLKRCKQVLGVDLAAEAVSGELFSKLADDPVFLVDVLYVLCSSQAEMAGISDEDFGRLMVGDCIEEATQSLAEAIVDFFPKARRELMRKLLAKTQEMQQRATQTAHEWLDSGKMEKMMNDELSRLTSSSSATSTPESSG